MRSAFIIGIVEMLALDVVAVVIKWCPSIDKLVVYFNKFKQEIGYKNTLTYKCLIKAA